MTWTSFLLSEQKACDDCYGKLNKITGQTCPSCYRPQNHQDTCKDCQTWEVDPKWRNALQQNVSVFEYNEALKEILALYKFRGDAAIAEVFKKDVVASFKKNFSNAKIDASIPIPLSPERLYERGFNQSELLANFLPLPQLNVLQRTHHEKQSKKSRHERITSSDVFSLSDSSKIKEKHILLVDDIYTTGSTLRHAAKLLLEKGASTVSSITLIRG